MIKISIIAYKYIRNSGKSSLSQIFEASGAASRSNFQTSEKGH